MANSRALRKASSHLLIAEMRRLPGSKGRPQCSLLRVDGAFSPIEQFPEDQSRPAIHPASVSALAIHRRSKCATGRSRPGQAQVTIGDFPSRWIAGSWGV